VVVPGCGHLLPRGGAREDSGRADHVPGSLPGEQLSGSPASSLRPDRLPSPDNRAQKAAPQPSRHTVLG